MRLLSSVIAGLTHMIELGCALAAPTTRLSHVWEHTVGCAHAPLLLRADLQSHLSECRRELGFGHVRFHGLLSAPMDAVICQNEEWLYSFFDADQIIDFLLSIGMKPFVELSFMPAALASGSKTVFHYRANVTPPKDPSEWGTLITRLVRHWMDRYGRDEVCRWPFEVWNEPNLEAFGSGRQADYFALYRETVRAIKDVDPSFQVGGPATAASAWIDDLLAFAQRSDLPVDFVSTHQYPTDAFGEPGDDTETQLSKSRRGVMREHARQVRQQCGDRPLYYTEWNTSSNPRDPLHDQPFAAAFAVNILMSVADVVDAYSWWTCSDIFNENYMPSIPYQGGFGLLNIHGVPKPVYRAFELLRRLGTSRLEVDGSEGTISAWASRIDATHISVLVTNHALPRHDVATERVHLIVRDALAPKAVSIERIEGLDYFENSRRATYVQQQYAIRNPKGFAGYSDQCWGITASDGPGPATRRVDGRARRFFDYVARGVPFGPDDGTIAPRACVASLPFAPEIVLPTVRHFLDLQLKTNNPYGFKATFNRTFPDHPDRPYGWISRWHVGLNQGPIVMMIENYRTGLLWRLMRCCEPIVLGLHRAGFSGGWLT